MQSLHNIDNYGYSLGQYQEMILPQRGGQQNVHNMGDQGLSPPYSNSQSPPHSVQSNLALSPQAYIGRYQLIFHNKCIFQKSFYH